jgi:hypothetical protein
MVHVEERRRRGQKNDPNLITITSSEWLTWLARGPKGIGFKKVTPTASRGFKQASPSRESRPESRTGRNGSEREPVGSVRASNRFALADP